MYSTYVPCVIATGNSRELLCAIGNVIFFLNHLELFIQLVRVHQALEMDGTAHANCVYFLADIWGTNVARALRIRHTVKCPPVQKRNTIPAGYNKFRNNYIRPPPEITRTIFSCTRRCCTAMGPLIF